jgi:predicted dithiol-disulfide oxidoreductase (DUF899 family)
MGSSVVLTNGVNMNITRTGSREEWLAARLDLLAKEKAASRQLAALAEARRALPAVAIDKDFGFEGPDGKVGLIDLFEGRSQLIVYHFMWLHDIDERPPRIAIQRPVARVLRSGIRREPMSLRTAPPLYGHSDCLP